MFIIKYENKTITAKNHTECAIALIKNGKNFKCLLKNGKEMCFEDFQKEIKNFKK